MRADCSQKVGSETNSVGHNPEIKNICQTFIAGCTLYVKFFNYRSRDLLKLSQRLQTKLSARFVIRLTYQSWSAATRPDSQQLKQTSTSPAHTALRGVMERIIVQCSLDSHTLTNHEIVTCYKSSGCRLKLVLLTSTYGCGYRLAL